MYSDWLLTQREKDHWDVADVHGIMKAYLEDQIRQNSSFALAPDGVHPAEAGHWLMSKAILLYLAEASVSEAGSIHAALAFHHAGEKILELVSQRQSIMKDAWLTAIGHQRPGMNTGLPLGEAVIKGKKIQRAIDELLK